MFYDRKFFCFDMFQPFLAVYTDLIRLGYHTGDDPEAQTRQAMLSNAVVPMSKVYRNLQLNVFGPFALSTMSVLNGEDHLLVKQCRSYSFLAGKFLL